MQNQTLNNLEYKARRSLILGTTGTGKSTLAHRLLYSHPAELILVYDWQGGEFAKRSGGSRASDRIELHDKIMEGHRIVCYMAEEGEDDPQGEGFEWFCDMVFELSGALPGRKLVVIDECQDLIDPYNMPESLGKVLSRGRRRMIDTCLIGRSANALQSQARDQVTELYCFRVIDSNSLKYPDSLGIDPTEVKSLKDTEFIYKDLRTGEQKRLELWGRKSISPKT